MTLRAPLRMISAILALVLPASCGPDRTEPEPSNVLDSAPDLTPDSTPDVVSQDLGLDVPNTAETQLADTVSVDALDARDAIGPSDTSIEPTGWALGGSYRIEGPANVWTSGELVAIYDHSLWWGEPDEDKTLALFDADRFAEWPDDGSVQFVTASEILSSEIIPPARPALRDWLTERRIGWGRVPIDGVAYVMAASERHHLGERGYGDYATDLGRTDDGGQRWTGDGLDLHDYLSWDVPVFAPTAGVIVEVTRDAPDSPIGGDPAALFDAPENLVGLWLGGAWHAYLLHFQEGSVPAELVVGRAVNEGELLGRIGNSGTSIEPHLHVVLHYWDAARGRYWSLPVDYFDVQTGSSPSGATPQARARPAGGTWISSTPF